MSSASCFGRIVWRSDACGDATTDSEEREHPHSGDATAPKH
jgi:hypothetical protein